MERKKETLEERGKRQRGSDRGRGRENRGTGVRV